jgi:CRISPR-associated protein Cmr3
MKAFNKSITWNMEALDTYFFRDSSPYNAGEGGMSGNRSVFPPFMTTLQGAIRTSLASGQGWSAEDHASWPQELGSADDLGQLKLEGPYLLRNNETLFPAPAHLIGLKVRGGLDVQCTRLNPGVIVECDLGRVRLPEQQKPLPGAGPMEGYWLSVEGMQAMLAGDIPSSEQVFPPESLWNWEHRTGIETEPGSRTAVKSKIYSCVHIRPHKEVILSVRVSGIPEDWHQAAVKVISLGGEGRMAVVHISNEEPVLPACPELKPVRGKIYFTVTIITPGRYSNIKSVIMFGPPGIPGRCVSACIGKLVSIGGWDLKKASPRPLEPLIPPGSTWFYEANEKELGNVLALHGINFGDPYGFGQIIIGKWEDER